MSKMLTNNDVKTVDLYNARLTPKRWRCSISRQASWVSEWVATAAAAEAVEAAAEAEAAEEAAAEAEEASVWRPDARQPDRAEPADWERGLRLQQQPHCSPLHTEPGWFSLPLFREGLLFNCRTFLFRCNSYKLIYTHPPTRPHHIPTTPH